MSFVPEFAPDALSQWRELDPELQEVVLDSIEALLANPPPPPTVRMYHDVYHEDDRGRHYIFVRVLVDRIRERITIAGVVDYLRPPSG